SLDPATETCGPTIVDRQGTEAEGQIHEPLHEDSCLGLDANPSRLVPVVGCPKSTRSRSDHGLRDCLVAFRPRRCYLRIPWMIRVGPTDGIRINSMDKAADGEVLGQGRFLRFVRRDGWEFVERVRPIRA